MEVERRAPALLARALPFKEYIHKHIFILTKGLNSMPFIDVKASCPISPEQEVQLKSGLGRAISLIPGKSESSLMLRFTGDCRMWMGGGQDGPIVMADMAIYGHTTQEAFSAFGESAVALIKETLGAKAVYLKLDQTTDWAF